MKAWDPGTGNLPSQEAESSSPGGMRASSGHQVGPEATEREPGMAEKLKQKESHPVNYLMCLC